MKNFESRVAVITGGASGIGLGMARAFAKRQMKLVIADLDQDAMSAAAAEFRGMNIDVVTKMSKRLLTLRWRPTARCTCCVTMPAWASQPPRIR